MDGRTDGRTDVAGRGPEVLPGAGWGPLLPGDALFPNTASKSTAMATEAGGGADWFSIPGGGTGKHQLVTAPVHVHREGPVVRLHPTPTLHRGLIE